MLTDKTTWHWRHHRPGFDHSPANTSHICPLCLQKSLGAKGIDTSAAVARVRSESRGRKRTRSASADPSEANGAAEGGDVEMGEAGNQKKRVHSSKSR